MHHITALIKFSENVPRPHTDGGVKSGYAPHHKFSNVEYLVSGFHDYADDKYHFTGESLVTKIAFPSWEDIHKLIHVGDSFEVRELNTLVGSGEVLSIDE